MELMRGSLTDLLYGKLSKDAAKVLTPSRQLGVSTQLVYALSLHSTQHNLIISREVSETLLVVSRLLKVSAGGWLSFTLTMSATAISNQRMYYSTASYRSSSVILHSQSSVRRRRSCKYTTKGPSPPQLDFKKG